MYFVLNFSFFLIFSYFVKKRVCAVLSDAVERAVLGDAVERAVVGDAVERAVLGDAVDRTVLGDAVDRAVLDDTVDRAVLDVPEFIVWITFSSEKLRLRIVT